MYAEISGSLHLYKTCWHSVLNYFWNWSLCPLWQLERHFFKYSLGSIDFPRLRSPEAIFCSLAIPSPFLFGLCCLLRNLHGNQCDGQCNPIPALASTLCHSVNTRDGVLVQGRWAAPLCWCSSSEADASCSVGFNNTKRSANEAGRRKGGSVPYWDGDCWEEREAGDRT